MYNDFDKVISAALEDDKKSLTDLGNRLFDIVEKVILVPVLIIFHCLRKRNTHQLCDLFYLFLIARKQSKNQNLTQTVSYHQAAVSILEDVMSRMA